MESSVDNIKGKVLSGLFWKFLERILAQLVSLIVSIVLARLLLPEEYGVVSLVTIFITFANILVSDGFGTALIQKKDADNIDFSTVFFFGIAFSIIIYILIFLSANIISGFYKMPILIPVLRVLALKIPLASINSVQQAYVSKNMIFKKFFWSTIIGTGVSAIVGIVMAYLGFGVWALVAQYMVNSIMDTVILWITVKWRPIFKFSLLKLKGLFKYGWKLLMQSLFLNLYSNIRSLVIGKVYTSSDLAYYNKGCQFPNLISTNVDTAISSTLFPAMSMEQKDKSKIKQMTKRAIKICSYVMSPLLIGLAACSNSFVKLILTEKWLPIVPYLQIMCITLLWRPVQTATLQSIKAIGRSDIVLMMDVPVRILGIILLIVSIKYGVIYIALSELVVELIGCLIYSKMCEKYIGYTIKEIFNDFSFNILIAVVMGICVYLLECKMNFGVFVNLMIDIIWGIIMYVILSILMKNENYFYLKNEIINLKNKYVK